MKATYALVHNRKNKLNKNGEALVQIQVYYNKKRKWLSSGIYLKPREWDAKRYEINANHPACDELNQELQEYLENLKTHERNLARTGKPLVLSKLSLDKLNEVSTGISFTEFWKIGIESNNQLEYDTSEPTDRPSSVL